MEVGCAYAPARGVNGRWPRSAGGRWVWQKVGGKRQAGARAGSPRARRRRRGLLAGFSGSDGERKQRCVRVGERGGALCCVRRARAARTHLYTFTHAIGNNHTYSSTLPSTVYYWEWDRISK